MGNEAARRWHYWSDRFAGGRRRAKLALLHLPPPPSAASTWAGRAVRSKGSASSKVSTVDGNGNLVLVGEDGGDSNGHVYCLLLSFSYVLLDVSHFQALMTALAATVGIGNIAGVATAIALGGPGAMFWMWMTGLVGMATKYAEASWAWNPGSRSPTAQRPAAPCCICRGGSGINGWASSSPFSPPSRPLGLGTWCRPIRLPTHCAILFIPTWMTGLVLMVGTAVVVLGGIQSIARVSTLMVPVMAAVYVLGGLVVLIVRADQIPGALGLIFSDAFTGTAVTGGFAGSTVMVAMRYGVARGVFSNESGLGTGGFAAAAAKSSTPRSRRLFP